MPIGGRLVGADVNLIVLWGDPDTAAQYASVLSAIDARSLSGKFAGLVKNVDLLQNAAGTYDLARSAAGTTGIPAINTEGTKPTYSAATIGFLPVATSTDFFNITGSATRTVRVTRIVISGIATAAASVATQLIKRSTANTGGTPTGLTMAPHDLNNAAATALIQTYAANPTLGTSVGLPGAETLNLGAAGAAGRIVFDFGTRNGQAGVLRGVAQSLNLNWNGAAVPAGTLLSIACEWTEEV